MTIAPVNNITTQQPAKKKIWKNSLRDTGYAAAALGIGSAIAGSRKKIKLHKYLALFAGVLTFIHIGIAEYYKQKSSKLACKKDSRNK